MSDQIRMMISSDAALALDAGGEHGQMPLKSPGLPCLFVFHCLTLEAGHKSGSPAGSHNSFLHGSMLTICKDALCVHMFHHPADYDVL